MKFSVTFRENSISLNKLNTVMNEVIGGITCLIAEGEWERLSWLETNDFGKDDVRKFAQKFLDQCFFSNSSPEEMYNKILNDFHMNDKQFSVSRKIIPTRITGKKHVIADRYYIDTLEDLIILEMLYAIERNISFMKCRHCGKYLASANAGAAYCDRKNENGKKHANRLPQREHSAKRLRQMKHSLFTRRHISRFTISPERQPMKRKPKCIKQKWWYCAVREWITKTGKFHQTNLLG